MRYNCFCEYNNFGWEKVSIEDTRQSSLQDELRFIILSRTRERGRHFLHECSRPRRVLIVTRSYPQNRSNDITENLSLSPLTGAASEHGSAATVHITGHIVEDSVGIAEQFAESARHRSASCDRVRSLNDQEKIGIKTQHVRNSRRGI